MTDLVANPWDGMPRNPERPGPHWITDEDGVTKVVEWLCGPAIPGAWSQSGVPGAALPADVALVWTYLGAVRMPGEQAEHDAEVRRAALEEAAVSVETISVEAEAEDGGDPMGIVSFLQNVAAGIRALSALDGAGA